MFIPLFFLLSSSFLAFNFSPTRNFTEIKQITGKQKKLEVLQLFQSRRKSSQNIGQFQKINQSPNFLIANQQETGHQKASIRLQPSRKLKLINFIEEKVIDINERRISQKKQQTKTFNFLNNQKRKLSQLNFQSFQHLKQFHEENQNKKINQTLTIISKNSYLTTYQSQRFLQTSSTQLIKNGDFSVNTCLTTWCLYTPATFKQSYIGSWQPDPEIEIGYGWFYIVGQKLNFRAAQLAANKGTCIKQLIQNAPEGNYTLNYTYGAKVLLPLDKAQIYVYFNTTKIDFHKPNDNKWHNATVQNITISRENSTFWFRICGNQSAGWYGMAVTNISMKLVQVITNSTSNSTKSITNSTSANSSTTTNTTTNTNTNTSISSSTNKSSSSNTTLNTTPNTTVLNISSSLNISTIKNISTSSNQSNTNVDTGNNASEDSNNTYSNQNNTNDTIENNTDNDPQSNQDASTTNTSEPSSSPPSSEDIFNSFNYHDVNQSQLLANYNPQASPLLIYLQLYKLLLGNSYINQMIKTPVARQAFRFAFSFFINLDHLWLYVYHKRDYSYYLKKIFLDIQNIQSQKWSFGSDFVDQNLLEYRSLDSFSDILSQKIPQTSIVFFALQQKSSEFLPNTYQFFILYIPMALFAYGFFRIIRKISLRYNFQNFFTNFSFLYFLKIIFLEGNSQPFAYFLFSDMRTLFSSSIIMSFQNMFSIFVLFTLILSLLAGPFVLQFIQRKHPQKYLYEECKNSLQGSLYFAVEFGLMNLLLGSVHILAQNYSTLQLGLLFSIQLGFTIFNIRNLINRKEVFEESFRVITSTASSFLRMNIILSLFLYTDTFNEIKVHIEYYQQICIIMYLMFWILAIFYSLGSEMVELVKFLIAQIKKLFSNKRISDGEDVSQNLKSQIFKSQEETIVKQSKTMAPSKIKILVVNVKTQDESKVKRWKLRKTKIPKFKSVKDIALSVKNQKIIQSSLKLSTIKRQRQRMNSFVII